MKKQLFGLPSWGLSLIAGVLITILLIVIGSLLETILGRGGEVGEGIGYIIYAIAIATVCFFICRNDPSSVWYVPILCNVGGIISAFVEPNFWITSMWIFICSGWILSVISAIIGAILGKKSFNSTVPR
ncbi:MAG: hypothetical protein OQJ93_13220 [Ignavibacteriaceae bacterium]|jgi:hypothetical protein|nr:hypothetical protein [Ignavibacteriaceae bacterium]MCW8813861.1 hypothetical protein [Chlorobium sp.]MCW8818478.1 hypothetical protein [Ignavibacteriaceae bacterium]MCW8822702.1 hypothetical protein [Ignavibacteriaceae bacterium]MCW8960225.1 hypothetical protein [Ignavibacteriaceae bacterium]